MRGSFGMAVVLSLLLAGCVSDDGDVAESAAPLVIPSYRGCTSPQRSMASAALGAAQTYAVGAKSYLDADTHGDRYTTWFGSYTSGRFAMARRNFNAISTTIQSKRITFDCGCSDDISAYVVPDEPYIIYLCNSFWSAPMTGTDSKGGAIIAALSHFIVVASTDDWGFGQSQCKSLATSDPDKAIDNADSYEYFAENRPVQN